MKDNGKLILSLVGGAVAGAVTALLLAPSSGEETRRKLVKSAEKVKNDINNTVESGMNKIHDLRTAASDEISNLGRRASNMMGSASDSVESSVGSTPPSSTSSNRGSSTTSNRGTL